MHKRLYSDGNEPPIYKYIPSTYIHAYILNKKKKIKPIEALTANLSTLSVSARERAAKDAAKKEAKAALAATRDQERKAAAKVIIRRVERNKRKFVTVLSGIEPHGLDNKKVSKELGKKFATGSSVTKSAIAASTGGPGDEITIQGDVSDDLYDWLVEVYGKEIPEDNIEFVEDKKKKAPTT